MQRAIVALKVTRRNSDRINFARSVARAMTDNPDFPSPTPSIAEFEALIAAASEAQAYVLIGPIGSAAARNARLAELWSALEHLESYVELVASQSAGRARAVIESAGMSVKRPGLSHRQPLEVKQGPVSGSVVVVSRSAGDRVSYEWQFAKEGESWVDAEPTRQAKTTLRGLVPRLLYSFRVRSVTKAGRSDFGNVVSFRVL